MAFRLHFEHGFEDYLERGRFEHALLSVRGDTCPVEHLVAFSCKWQSFCPSRGARRMPSPTLFIFQ